jgi:hypothetical protein
LSEKSVELVANELMLRRCQVSAGEELGSLDVHGVDAEEEESGLENGVEGDIGLELLVVEDGVGELHNDVVLGVGDAVRGSRVSDDAVGKERRRRRGERKKRLTSNGGCRRATSSMTSFQQGDELAPNGSQAAKWMERKEKKSSLNSTAVGFRGAAELHPPALCPPFREVRCLKASDGREKRRSSGERAGKSMRRWRTER